MCRVVVQNVGIGSSPVASRPAKTILASGTLVLGDGTAIVEATETSCPTSGLATADESRSRFVRDDRSTVADSAVKAAKIAKAAAARGVGLRECVMTCDMVDLPVVDEGRLRWPSLVRTESAR